MKETKRLRQQIADHIEKSLYKHQRVAYNFRDVAEIETDQEVYLNIADAIIPLVKGALKERESVKSA